MAYLIPALLIASGVVAIVNGVKMIINKDDSLDEKAKEVFNNLPAHIQKHIDRLEPTEDGGIAYRLKAGAPSDIEDELEEIIEIES